MTGRAYPTEMTGDDQRERRIALLTRRLPASVQLLTEDVAPLRRQTERLLGRIEHRRPHWMGLPSQ